MQPFKIPTPFSPGVRNTRKFAKPVAFGAACLLSLLTACGGGGGSSAPAATAPTISTQPTSVTVVAPATATFTVAAAGTSPTYQWKRNGTALANTANASYTTPATTAADDAAHFSVTVSNSLGSVTSADATLHVNFVTINGQPTNQATTTGGNATFSVGAAGATGGTLSYQWKKDGSAISGATSASLALTGVSATDMASYSCDVVGQLNGTTTPVTTTAAATLALVDPPVITGQPGDQTVGEGAPASFTVSATGGGTLSYQWRVRNAPIVGATSATLLIPAAALTDEGSYSCIVTNTQNGAAQIRSTSPAILRVVTLPIFSSQPTGATIFPGDAYILSAAATANGTLTYQWRKGGIDLPGATGSSYVITSATVADGGDYTCIATNTQFGVAASATSNVATVIVQLSPAITSEPGSRSVMDGQTASFSITAKGLGLTYTWYKNGTAIPASNAPSYTTPAVTLADTGAQFWCVVSNGTPPDVTSATATLTVTPMVTQFKASSQSLSLGEGVILTYTFDASSTATLQIGGGTPATVISGGSTIDYPGGNTTYSLAVTSAGTTTTTSLSVVVKTYTPTNLYVVNHDSNDLYHYPVTPTSSTFVGTPAGSPVATGTGPVHVVASPDEKYLYVTNNTGASISAYSVDATTGALTSLGAATTLTTYGSPWCSAVDPTGSRLYVACDNGIEVFTLTPGTGVPVAAPSLNLALPGRVQGDLLMHPSGAYLFVADYGHSKVKAYAIDPTTGALSFSSEVTTDTNPTGLTFDRAASLLFTRGNSAGTDGSGHPFNAAVDVISLDLQTGILTSKSTFAGYGAQPAYSTANGAPFYGPFVRGTNGRHGLAFSRKPGIDHLFNGYVGDAVFGSYFSEYTVDLPSATVTGDFANPLWGIGSPYFISNWSLFTSGSDSIIGDRSGTIFIVPLPDSGVLISFKSDNNGRITAMANFSGEITRATGTNPAHGCFTGTLQ